MSSRGRLLLDMALQKATHRNSDDSDKNLTNSSKGKVGVFDSQNEDKMQHLSPTHQKDETIATDYLAEAVADRTIVTEYFLVPSETTEDSFILKPIPSTSGQVSEIFNEGMFDQDQHSDTVSIGHDTGLVEFGTLLNNNITDIAVSIPLVDIDMFNQVADDLGDTDLRLQLESIDNNHVNFVNTHVNIVNYEHKREGNGCEEKTVFKNKESTDGQIYDKVNEEGGAIDEIQLNEDEEWLPDNEGFEDEQISESMCEENEENIGEYLPEHQPNIPGNINHSMEVAGNKKRSKRGRADKNTWTAEKNKIKREQGEEYFGRNKNEKGKTVFDQKRPKKVIKPRCKCKNGPKIVFKCHKITDEARQILFKKFWNLNRGEKKIFVQQLVERKTVSHRRVEPSSSRRSQSLFYYFKVNGNGDRVRVCKTMFLNTLSVGEWSVLNWVSNDCNTMSEETPNKYNGTNINKKGPSEERKLIKQFLDSLPKLESHYCRKDTKKLYLEPRWQSKSELYREYKAYCTGQNKDNLQLSIFTFWSVFEECDLGLFSPKKDLCDICCSFNKGNLDKEEYEAHQKRKEEARKEKTTDKENINEERTAVFTLDVQAVLLSPSLKASALYYRTKLKIHNLTIFNLKTADGYCFLWDETEGGVTANEFASIVYHFLSEIDKTMYDNVIFYSDGCTYQNRNSVLSNALLLASKVTGLTIYQKYLEKGHTQMECDSIHSTIEKKLRNREIYSPAGYIEVCKTARLNPKPYQVKYLEHTFFLKYSALQFLSSIRPGTKKGDPVVTDLKCIKYNPMGLLAVKISFSGNFFELPRRISKPSGKEVLQPLYLSKIPLEAVKFKHLQEMKPVLPKDVHPYYDGLPHFLPVPGHKLCNWRQGSCQCVIHFH